METTTALAWLASLERDPSSYQRLVESSGGLAGAAYQVAKARCAMEPSSDQIASVAKEIAARLGYYDVLPSRTSLKQ